MREVIEEYGGMILAAACTLANIAVWACVFMAEDAPIARLIQSWIGGGGL